MAHPSFDFEFLEDQTQFVHRLKQIQPEKMSYAYPFKHIIIGDIVTASDLGAKKVRNQLIIPKDGEKYHCMILTFRMQHNMQTIQQRSNSLFPYELLEIIHAKAEVIEDAANNIKMLSLTLQKISSFVSFVAWNWTCNNIVLKTMS